MFDSRFLHVLNRPAIAASVILLLGAAACGNPPRPPVEADDPDTTEESVVEPTPADAPTAPEEKATEEAQSDTTATPAEPSDAPDTPVESQPQSAAADTETITIYKIDDQCQDFVPREVSVPKDSSMEAAVGKVLDDWGGGNFDLAGYRLDYDDASGTAAVDLRVAPDSPRQIISLSSCERTALFGAVEKTLLDNPDWNVESVTFTESGQEIYF